MLKYPPVGLRPFDPVVCMTRVVVFDTQSKLTSSNTFNLPVPKWVVSADGYTVKFPKSCVDDVVMLACMKQTKKKTCYYLVCQDTNAWYP